MKFDSEELRKAFIEAQVLWQRCFDELPPVICLWEENGVTRAKMPQRWGKDGSYIYIDDEAIPRGHSKVFPPDVTWERPELNIRCNDDGETYMDGDDESGPYTADEMVTRIDEGSHYDDEYAAWIDELDAAEEQAVENWR